ncbi:4F2 cell-surface antigen heavy chain [Acomys russatus]|uniref:4F2 cell-surface antigen heavy chain n=1 Tax=Acomys russatus TaxID=60746 RepID=UPI0021E24536|nr:4F2 cell-surface antigen heavy chain [Acomys russatus]
MSQDTEVDMKEMELNELEPEKQPMNAAAGASAGEKNGLVKIQVAKDESETEAKFTGLSKEELLYVAGSPGWVRTRLTLLALFWLGWFAMLAGAVVIIVRAPRCRELPVQSWWQEGALYRIGNLQAFVGPNVEGFTGLDDRLDYLNTLKVKGLVLGPIHLNQKDDVNGTDLKQIDPAFGSQKDFKDLVERAKEKSIRIILDLTPNYHGQEAWFLPEEADVVATKMKEALRVWLQYGIDGFQFRDVEKLADASLYLAEWQNITNNFSNDRLLMAGTESSDLQQIVSILNSTSDLLLTSSYLSNSSFTGEHTKFLVTRHLDATGSRWLSWSVSQAGLLTASVPAQLHRLYQLLLFTLPGTPVFSYGDEIGLEATTLPGQPVEAPFMPWDESSISHSPRPINSNMTVKGQNEDPDSLLTQFRRLSDLRVKERSLLHGDFHVLSSSSGLFSYIRSWDQNKRYLVVLNFQDVGLSARIGAANLPGGISLPASANLVLSTSSARPSSEDGTSLNLENLSLNPHEGLLLYFPYVS